MIRHQRITGAAPAHHTASNASPERPSEAPPADTRGNDLDLVFTREDGSPIHPQTFSQSFERHVDGAKLPKLSLHSLRQTHATLALRAGVHPKVVSERLGHASVAFTLDTYTDSLPDMQETAASLVAQLVLGDAGLQSVSNAA
jgi:integrase